MMRSAILAAFIAALFGYARDTRAQTTVVYPCTATSPCTFTTVDSLFTSGSTLRVSGILEGEAAPTERSVSFSGTNTSPNDWLAACERLALLAMAKPGQYVLRLEANASVSSIGVCRLTRVSL